MVSNYSRQVQFLLCEDVYFGFIICVGVAGCFVEPPKLYSSSYVFRVNVIGGVLWPSLAFSGPRLGFWPDIDSICFNSCSRGALESLEQPAAFFKPERKMKIVSFCVFL